MGRMHPGVKVMNVFDDLFPNFLSLKQCAPKVWKSPDGGCDASFLRQCSTLK